jgi:hypothetical protein
MEMERVKCWCCPPRMVYVTLGNLCTWPDCVCGKMADPKEVVDVKGREGVKEGS